MKWLCNSRENDSSQYLFTSPGAGLEVLQGRGGAILVYDILLSMTFLLLIIRSRSPCRDTNVLMWGLTRIFSMSVYELRKLKTIFLLVTFLNIVHV